MCEIHHHHLYGENLGKVELQLWLGEKAPISLNFKLLKDWNTCQNRPNQVFQAFPSCQEAASSSRTNSDFPTNSLKTSTSDPRKLRLSFQYSYHQANPATISTSFPGSFDFPQEGPLSLVERRKTQGTRLPQSSFIASIKQWTTNMYHFRFIAVVSRIQRGMFRSLHAKIFNLWNDFADEKKLLWPTIQRSTWNLNKMFT